MDAHITHFYLPLLEDSHFLHGHLTDGPISNPRVTNERYGFVFLLTPFGMLQANWFGHRVLSKSRVLFDTFQKITYFYPTTASEVHTASFPNPWKSMILSYYVHILQLVPGSFESNHTFPQIGKTGWLIGKTLNL